MIEGLTNSDGIPALERLMQFTSQRHRVILDNVANLSTPGFRPRDVSTKAFQSMLGEAIDMQRDGRASTVRDGGLPLPNGSGPMASVGAVALGLEQPLIRSSQSGLPMRGSREVEVRHDGLTLHPEPMDDNILFHDGNDRSVERVMQSLVENFMAFRTAAQLLRNRLSVISMAIRERL